jgi:hypothetical protein
MVLDCTSWYTSYHGYILVRRNTFFTYMVPDGTRWHQIIHRSSGVTFFILNIMIGIFLDVVN